MNKRCWRRTWRLRAVEVDTERVEWMSAQRVVYEEVGRMGCGRGRGQVARLLARSLAFEGLAECWCWPLARAPRAEASRGLPEGISILLNPLDGAIFARFGPQAASKRRQPWTCGRNRRWSCCVFPKQHKELSPTRSLSSRALRRKPPSSLLTLEQGGRKLQLHK